MVSGYPLEMTGQPRQARPTKPLQFTRDLDRLVTEEVRKLEAKSAIRPVEPTLDQFTSQIFLVPKKDRSQRPVVNLKEPLDCEEKVQDGRSEGCGPEGWELKGIHLSGL